jgi:hypothetical protein
VHEILRRYRIACNRLPKAAAYLDNLKGEVLPVRRASLLDEALNERGRALGTPELVEKVDRGLIPVSTASKLVVLPKAEQVKIATTEDPVRAARKAIEEPEMHRPAKPITGWSLEQVQVECEKIPTSEINDWVLSPAERPISHEQREQLVMAVRAAAQRLTSLGDQIEEVSLCALKSCRMARGKREKRAPGQKYCSPVCADRAGARSAWRRPTAVDVD